MLFGTGAVFTIITEPVRATRDKLIPYIGRVAHLNAALLFNLR
jgi:hypothetical protein